MVVVRGEGGEDVVAGALRLALAEKLHVDPAELEGLDSEAAAAALRHFVQREGGAERLPAWVDEPRPETDAGELIAFGVRTALAYELGVRPEQLVNMRVLGAARALDRIRSQRLARGVADTPIDRPAIVDDHRRLVEHILHEALAEQLDLPVTEIDLRPELAAHILVRLLEQRAPVRELHGEVANPELPDRRDLVARVVRDAIAQDIAVHPRLLGSLDPTAAAVLLSRFAEARRSLDQLRSTVATDELTGALRRSAGEAELEREMARMRRVANGRLVVAFVDVDALKVVNDTQGHSAGDDLLRALAETLRHRLRAYDTVARWGGDEFLVILPQADLDSARSIMDQVSLLFTERTSETFSYGLGALEENDSLVQIVSRADARLYEAKRARSMPAADTAPVSSEAAEPPDVAAPDPEPQPAGFWRRLWRRLRAA